MQAVQSGLTIEQFWDMSWRDWSIYNIANQRKEINEWARARRIAYMVYVMGSSEKIKMKEEKFHPLPIDEAEYKGEPITMEQFKNTVNLYSKI